jgi:hypothetical protein
MKLETIFKLSAQKLKQNLRAELVKLGYSEKSLHNKSKFLYAEGDAPYMLVAHLDTVHKDLPSIICYSNDGNYMMSPQGIGGDDRCGVYIILELLKKLPYRPYVVFTMDEEVGGLGAMAFSNYIDQHDMPELKYIVEYDRKGNEDCVFYDCDNKEFVEFVESFGFKEDYGTFTVICDIAPTMGVAAVNLSSGYFSPHTEHEYVSLKDVRNIIDKSYKMLCAECDGFKYVKKEHSYSHYYVGKKIAVSFVPEETLYLYAWRNGEYYLNDDKEIVVDKDGNYYYYDSTYKDLMSVYGDVEPVDPDNIPSYDPKNFQLLTVYY